MRHWDIVFVLRMLSVFMVFPVLTTFGMNLYEANELLVGISIGIYGLMQAIFQIPLGIVSDRFGHKLLIVCGLLIFSLGSAVVAITNNIWGGYYW